MSLAVLARKTKTKLRSRSIKCGNGTRTKGHVLNMTGRGGGIGLSGLSFKYRGSGCNRGGSATCCEANSTTSKECRNGCSCHYAGLSQPAPQMSYRTYLNRKSNGAFRPGGRPCNCKSINDVQNAKPIQTWKQHPNISASEITEHRKQSTIRCAKGMEFRNETTNKLDAKPVCSWKNPATGKYETVKNCNPYGSNNCARPCGLKIKGRLGYTRINKNWCNTTKSVEQGKSSSDQISKVKERAFLCKCSDECKNTGTNKNASCFRYCYPKPMMNAHCAGALTPAEKAKIACLRRADSTC
jgi:hypothetical protein